MTVPLFKPIDQIGWLCKGNNLSNGVSWRIRSRPITYFPPPSSGIEDNPTIFYQLIRGSTDQTNKYDTFYLQQRQDNGWTYADVKVNQPLDFERIKEYNLTIRVEVSFNISLGAFVPWRPVFLDNSKLNVFSSFSRTTEPNSLQAKPPSSSCWRTSMTRSPSSQRGSRRRWWRESPLAPRSPGWSSSYPNGGNQWGWPGGCAALCPIHPHYPLSRKPLTPPAFLRICIMSILILVVIILFWSFSFHFEDCEIFFLSFLHL